MINANDIINRIKEKENFSGYGSEAHLARFLHISPQTLDGWRKRRSISFKTIFEKCTGYDLTWLITGKSFPNPDPPVSSELLHNQAWDHRELIRQGTELRYLRQQMDLISLERDLLYTLLLKLQLRRKREQLPETVREEREPVVENVAQLIDILAETFAKARMEGAPEVFTGLGVGDTGGFQPLPLRCNP